MLDLEEMAREAAEYADSVLPWSKVRDERFAALIALRVTDAAKAEEREACAKVCDDLMRTYQELWNDIDKPDAADCAKAIRERSTNEGSRRETNAHIGRAGLSD